MLLLLPIPRCLQVSGVLGQASPPSSLSCGLLQLCLASLALNCQLDTALLEEGLGLPGLPITGHLNILEAVESREHTKAGL